MIDFVEEITKFADGLMEEQEIKDKAYLESQSEATQARFEDFRQLNVSRIAILRDIIVGWWGRLSLTDIAFRLIVLRMADVGSELPYQKFLVFILKLSTE